MTVLDMDSMSRSGGWVHARSAEACGDLAHGSVCTAVVAMVGHDLRQPLQAITSAHEVLARMLHAPEQREELARAETATSRLASMLSQLVDAVELEERSAQYRHEPVAVRPIFRQLAFEFGGAAQARNIAFRFIPGSAVVWSHPVMLSGILRNLVRNAIDYTPRGGRICVSCRRRGSEIHIDVRDSGVGIAPGQLVKIFEAFHRSDSTRADGLGLGLFIVQRAAQLLGHRVAVRSAPGRGSCFTIVAQRPFFEPAAHGASSAPLRTGTRWQQTAA
jgi:signal transduction histidine kinase